MTWVIIVAGIALYFAGMGATLVVAAREDLDADMAVPASVFWPLTLFLFLGATEARRLTATSTLPKAIVHSTGDDGE